MKKTTQKINKNLIYLSVIVLVLILIVLLFKSFNNLNNQNQSKNTVNRQNCLAEDCLLVDNLNYPVEELSQSIKDALDEAINDEYKAYSTYEAIIKKFGNIRPFSMIIRAEEQHISSLKSIYDKYGLDIPQNTWSKKVTAPATIQLACQTGVDAEIANTSLYQDKLLPAVVDYPDITQVFESLMTASQQKHLPAFQRCQ